MASSGQVRVALLGFGHGGAVFHAPLIASTPGMTLAAIVTGNPERQARAAREYPSAAILSSAEALWDVAQNVAQYDLVVIATPNRTHVPLAIDAMRAGLPVVVDKPIAATAADAERLIAVSQETGKLLTVFQIARWSNAFLTIRRLLADDLLGPVVRFEARMERYRPIPRQGAWRERGAPEEAGGLLYDLGSHMIDQALMLFGTPLRVYAELDYRRPGTQVDDDTFVAIEFESHARAHLWASYVARRPGPAARIWGLRGSYEKRYGDRQEEALRAGQRPGEGVWGVEPAEHWAHLSADVGGVHVEGAVESLPGDYPAFYAAVRVALLTGAAPPVDPRDAVQTMRVIEAAQRSAREHVVVAL